MAVIEQVLIAERGAHRQVAGLHERPDIGAGLRRPAAAADDHHWPLRLVEQLAQLRHVVGRGRAAGDLVGAGIGHLDLVDQHVLGQGDHDRTRPAVQCRMEGLAHQLRNTACVLDLDDPLGQLAEHAAIVDLLERLPIGRLARHLADQQDHGRRILEAGMQADAGIGRARPAGDEADARPAGKLAVGFRHVGRPALLTADDVANRIALGIKRVEGCEIALAGDAEDGVGPVNAELVDQDLRAAAARAGACHDLSFTSWVRTTWAPISCYSCAS